MTVLDTKVLSAVMRRDPDCRTRYRPVRGARGWFRAVMRHGVSTVTSGRRYTLGIIFHDAQ